jgi:hypothetical protein
LLPVWEAYYFRKRFLDSSILEKHYWDYVDDYAKKSPRNRCSDFVLGDLPENLLVIVLYFPKLFQKSNETTNN